MRVPGLDQTKLVGSDFDMALLVRHRLTESSFT
jgi:hypothetical protein